jgi:hypothetical protein
LVAAAAAAEPGGLAQQQLFALYVSKLKVLLYNPASKKASLIAMHPIEQVGLNHATVTVRSGKGPVRVDPARAQAGEQNLCRPQVHMQQLYHLPDYVLTMSVGFSSGVRC